MKFGIGNTAWSLTGILALVQAIMSDVLHCSAGAEVLNATCALPSWVPTAWAGYAAIVFGIIGLAAKFMAPGGTAANFWGQKAVILDEMHPKSGVGTVTPEQVAQP